MNKREKIGSRITRPAYPVDSVGDPLGLCTRRYINYTPWASAGRNTLSEVRGVVILSVLNRIKAFQQQDYARNIKIK